MEELKWYHWVLIALGVFVLILIFNEKVRSNFMYWLCNVKNKNKKKGYPCNNCIPPNSNQASYKGIIDNGTCIQDPAEVYAKCLENNASKQEGVECDNCVPPAGVSSEGTTILDGYVTQYKGIIIDGKCMPLPDAFAGKMCVPATASVKSAPISYKRIIEEGTGINGIPAFYRYFKSPTNTVMQGTGSDLDDEIQKDEFIQSYIQTIKPCAEGQIKV